MTVLSTKESTTINIVSELCKALYQVYSTALQEMAAGAGVCTITIKHPEYITSTKFCINYVKEFT